MDEIHFVQEKYFPFSCFQNLNLNIIKFSKTFDSSDPIEHQTSVNLSAISIASANIVIPSIILYYSWKMISTFCCYIFLTFVQSDRTSNKEFNEFTKFFHVRRVAFLDSLFTSAVAFLNEILNGNFNRYNVNIFRLEKFLWCHYFRRI